jgi:prevent-host-death family protein
MDIIGAFEAKTHFSSLLERVAKGERFTIITHGTPIAQLVPGVSVTLMSSRPSCSVWRSSPRISR